MGLRNLLFQPKIEKMRSQRDIEGLADVLINKSDPYYRHKAAEALGVLRDKRSVKPLVKGLSDKDPLVREESAKSLGKIGLGGPPVEPLISALKDESEGVRLAAVEALGIIGDTKAVGPLFHLLSDTDTNVRDRARFVIVEQLSGEGALKSLGWALRHRTPLVRRTAAQALGRTGDPRARKPLNKALSRGEEDEGVRRAIEKSLEMIPPQELAEEHEEEEAPEEIEQY
jgi:hypothetical protein